MKIAPDIEKRLGRLVPVEIAADESALSPQDLKVLSLLGEASGLIDRVFQQQVWRNNAGVIARLDTLSGPLADAARAYYLDFNLGPWDRLSGMEPFLGELAHPPGAGYYPEDMSREELESWIAHHPDQKEALTSLYTVVERQGSGFEAVPYSKAYRQWLAPASHLLIEAAKATDNASLKDFLAKRAQAFLSDDYFASEVAWMDLDAPVEITIGPYETYEDGLFGYKAAFEAYLTVNLPQESAKLARYKSELPWLERNLPIDDRFKNLSRGTDSPIRVVDLALAAGDARAGIPAVAYNLPNDERVRDAKGSKKVLMRNVMRAKFEKILQPIAQRVLASEELPRVSFDAFLEEVLHHELSHGLGPGTITKDGQKTEVRKELKELFSPLEEAKADVMGVYNLLALMDKGVVAKSLQAELEPTYVAGLFRAARFGVHEAHGKGVVTQFNYLLAQGALKVDPDGRFRAVPEKFPGAIRSLLGEMLLLQAHGDYAGTQKFLDRWGKPGPELEKALARLEDVPVDIRARYRSRQG